MMLVVFGTTKAANGPAERLARINSVSSGLAQDDLEIIVRPSYVQWFLIDSASSIYFSYRPRGYKGSVCCLRESGEKLFYLRIALVIPKVHSASDIYFVLEAIEKHAHPDIKSTLKLVASFESARAIMNLKEVCRNKQTDF
jgi:citrate lyase beta subunit